MSIEKPISTIRKAIKGLAESRAEKESIDKPERRHYESVFDTFKMLRMLEPQRLEVAIKINAQEHELKNEMGNELHKIFGLAWTDAKNETQKRIDEVVKRLKRTINLSQKQINEEIKKLDEGFLEEITNRVRNDSRIVDAFSGKEELLNKAIDITISGFRELMRYKDATKGR